MNGPDTAASVPAPAAPRAPLRLLRDLSKLGAAWKMLWPHAAPYLGRAAAGVAASAALIAMRLAQPWPLKWLIDSLTGRAAAPFPGLSPEWTAPALGAAYLAASALAALAEYAQQMLLAGLGNRVIFDFRNRLFSHLLLLPLAYHERRQAGELLTRVVYDTARLKRGLNGVLIRFFQVFFLFLATVAVLVWLDWRLAAVVGGFGLAALAAMLASGGRILRTARKNRRREGQLAGMAADILLSLRELKIYRPEGAGDRRFELGNGRSLRYDQKLRRLSALLLLRVDLLLAAGVCAVLWSGGADLAAGALTPGGLVLFLYYVNGLNGPFRQFARQASQTGRTAACAGRLVKLMRKEPEPLAAAGVPPPPARGELAFAGVSCRADKRRRAGRRLLLEEVSFRVAPGERVAVTGPNGAGKSTLLRLLLRLSAPAAGTVALDGRDVGELPLAYLRAQFSVMFQESVFPGLTIAENIALGRPGAAQGEVEDAARRCGIHAWITGLRHGYATVVRRQGGLFSGGERQKIALCRAALRGGAVWLLDEPANHLDAASSRALTALIKGSAAGRTVLWVTHDRDVLGDFDKVLFLREGRALFFGPPAEFSAWLAGSPETGGIICKP